ncbi:NUDIX hydrolase [Telmatobacter bradus]|uniref:NUDIX hydrolase n=1 Tax=Telmatobacter bradus TaxID=474953 RepID=UPI003B430D07
MQREFPETPLVGVGAVIIRDGRVLLIKRGTEPMKGCWSIPGGLIELGEDLHDAVRRETREETSLTIEPLELVELLDRIYKEEDRVRYHYVIADYLCRVVAGEAQAGSDAAAVRWASVEECQPGGLLNLDPITARIVLAGLKQAAAHPAFA